MKVRSLSAAALVAVIGVGVLFPAAASASTTGAPYVGTGDVTIRGGGINPDPGENELPDPEIPGIVNPDPVIPINPDPGNLAVVRVAPLHFGNVDTGTGAVRQPAAAVSGTKTAPDGTVTPATRGHMVQFEDARGTRAGYTMKAQLTKQFTSTTTPTEELTAASLSYTNGIITTYGGGVTPTLFASAFDLTFGGDAVTVVGAAAGQGSGKFVIEYGQSTDYNTSNDPAYVATDDNAVFLNIPESTTGNMLAGSYEAEITWTMEAAPYVATP